MDSLVSRWFDPGAPQVIPIREMHRVAESACNPCVWGALEPVPDVRRIRPVTYWGRDLGLKDLEVVYSGAGRRIVSDLENAPTRAGTAGGTFRAVLRR